MTADDRGAELDRVLVHGRQPTRVHLVEYEETWPERFAVERDRILRALGRQALAVHPDDEPAYLPELLDAGYALQVVEPQHEWPDVNYYAAAKGPVVQEILTAADGESAGP